MRPGKYDCKHQLLITGAELRELKELDLAESFGLDRRIERYHRVFLPLPRHSPGVLAIFGFGTQVVLIGVEQNIRVQLNLHFVLGDFRCCDHRP